MQTAPGPEWSGAGRNDGNYSTTLVLRGDVATLSEGDPVPAEVEINGRVDYDTVIGGSNSAVDTEWSRCANRLSPDVLGRAPGSHEPRFRPGNGDPRRTPGPAGVVTPRRRPSPGPEPGATTSSTPLLPPSRRTWSAA